MRDNSMIKTVGHSPAIFCLLAVLSVWTAREIAAQGDSQPKGNVLLPAALEIELALAAAPPHLRAEATVYVFGAAGYKQVQVGSNGVNCLVNRDGHQHGGNELRPTCWDAEGGATILPVVLRVGELLASGVDAEAIHQDIERGFEAGQFTSPRKTGIAYMLRGDVTYDADTRTVARTIFPPHYMIYAPGVTNNDIGAPGPGEESDRPLPFVYDGYSGGSRTSYIIILAADG